MILDDRGDPDGAMALLKEQERICRELSIKDGLAHSLGNQALILQACGDLKGAMALHKEVERISRELGSTEDLARGLANQASILGFGLNRPAQALVLADEAHDLAASSGYAPLARQIEGILRQIRARLK